MKIKRNEKQIEDLSYIKKLRDNISNFDSIPGKLSFLDITEWENDEKIKILKSECSVNLEDYGNFDQIGFCISELQAEKTEVRDPEGRIIGVLNDLTLRPDFGSKERKAFEKKHSHFIKGLENLYKIQYWITEERKFLLGQVIKSPQASVPNQKNNANSNKVSKVRLIPWQGTEVQLSYLFDKLKENGFISPAVWMEKGAYISKHFLNNKNEPLSNKQINQSKQNVLSSKTGEPRGASKIKEIVNEVKNKT
jgi:hypothetical protein